jgi:hypothetical protein
MNPKLFWLLYWKYIVVFVVGFVLGILTDASYFLRAILF